MKCTLLLLLALALPTFSLAGFSDLSEAELYQYQGPSKLKNRERVVSHPRSNSREMIELNQKILESERQNTILLERQAKTLQVRRKDDKILALTRVHGVVLNSILAMNTHPSKFIVRLGDDNELLSMGELRCSGYCFEKRVPAKCDLLVIGEQEYQVDVDIWDLDGAEGVIADYFYDGEEKAFLTSSFASFMQGVLDVGKDRITTPFGDTARDNAKNKVLGGLMGVADNVQKRIADSGEKNLQIAYIDSGKKILAFFNQTLTLSREEVR